jgi:CBS domain-containing protein
VRSITLFAIGGVASIEKDAGDPATEFWMGIVGPLTSAALGLFFAALAGVAPWNGVLVAADPWTTALVWLSTINIVLAVFNMVPGFPLDGGRVLRAAMWWLSGSPDHATRFASRVGQAVGLLLIGFGIWQFFAVRGLGSFWLALIGWFLLDAATTSYAGVDLIAEPRGLRVRDIMSEDCLRVDGRSTLQHFADAYVLGTAGRCFVVEEDGHVTRLVTPSDLARIERSQWGRMTVRQVARPFNRLRSVTPETPLIDALRTMGREDVNQVPVVSGGRLEGVLSRGRVLQSLDTRAQLSM